MGSPPHSFIIPANTSELNSTMSPGFSALPTGTSSLPVGMTATRGRRRTASASKPAAAHAPRSTGRSR